MKAELNDGSIVELHKECDCKDHSEPHWFYSNEIWRKLNLEIPLESDKVSSLSLFHYKAQQEILRLEEKQRYFNIFNIKRIIDV